MYNNYRFLLEYNIFHMNIIRSAKFYHHFIFPCECRIKFYLIDCSIEGVSGLFVEVWTAWLG